MMKLDEVEAFMINHDEVVKNLEIITNIEPFINEYKQEGTNFPAEKDDWKKIEENNVTITLNVQYAKARKNKFSLCFKT